MINLTETTNTNADNIRRHDCVVDNGNKDKTSWQNFDLYNPTEEHSLLRSSLKKFVQEEVEPQAQESNRLEIFNFALFKKLAELGILGLTVPECFGGTEMDAISAVIVHEELSYSDAGFCLAYLSHSMLCANNIAFNANLEQKQALLPKLCSGEWLGAMAMSEPDYGTDVLGMKTTAIKKDSHYILNGRKMWITNAYTDNVAILSNNKDIAANNTQTTSNTDDIINSADCVLVYARTGEQNGKPQISTFIVEKGFTGFCVGQKIKDKLGMRASSTAELIFENCHVPIKNLIGQEGQSLEHMMRNLEIERVTLAAMSLGIAKRCLFEMNRYANERHAFNKPLIYFGQIQRYIADSFAEYQSARAYVYNTARCLKLNKAGQRLDSDGVKLIASVMAKNVADRAIQILGGCGYVGEYKVERFWRDAKLLEIGGGTIEAHQKNITRDLSRNSTFLTNA